MIPIVTNSEGGEEDVVVMVIQVGGGPAVSTIGAGLELHAKLQKQHSKALQAYITILSVT